MSKHYHATYQTAYDLMLAASNVPRQIHQEVMRASDGSVQACTLTPHAVYYAKPVDLLHAGDPIPVADGLVPRWASEQLDAVLIDWHCDGACGNSHRCTPQGDLTRLLELQR